MLFLFFAIFLGAVLGVDPGKGWLYCVYQKEFRGARAAFWSFAANVFGIAITTLLMLLPALIARSLGVMLNALLLVYAFGSIFHGALKLVFPNVHYRGSLKQGTRSVFVWSVVNSAWAGYGFPLGALLLLEGYTTFVAFLFVYAVLCAFMFALCTKFGLMLAKKIWLNYDLFLSVFYVLFGSFTLFRTPFV
ncbi:hypothetical protein B9Q12_03325 [Candidatus Marsarchaeota G2 archaeon ECH_B_SAG-G06]|uniref:Lysine transporter LysE n=1 Tax=Candidatus Marsarchaeota G2 archaeon ECH_B_SAG-G06 TaxID=1978166 RepID=A0A2R6BZA4_9ARCH|nr:MAG: hypothetical protein B9Q12_03325 [Candidatus Marsarchaeota G2 archaeon ECH_B_SAG-G06]